MNTEKRKALEELKRQVKNGGIKHGSSSGLALNNFRKDFGFCSTSYQELIEITVDKKNHGLCRAIFGNVLSKKELQEINKDDFLRNQLIKAVNNKGYAVAYILIEKISESNLETNKLTG